MVNKVLLAANISANFKSFLKEKNFEIVPYEDKILNPQILQSIKGIITSNKLNLTKELIMQFPNLQWIARVGSGMEIIDTNYCDQHNIRYFSSPEGIANSVAEHVMGMLLCLLHKIAFSHNEIIDGKWIREANRGVELEDLTIGIIGYGHTGSRLCKKLSAFTKNILVFDKYFSGYSNEFVQECTLLGIQEQADIISFHVPLNAETHHYYDTDFVTKMKKNHILLNSARGAVADSAAILHGLQTGKIQGACLDVLEEEKNIPATLQKEHNIIQQLLKHQVILTPHIAGYSHNAIDKMSTELTEQLKEIL